MTLDPAFNTPNYDRTTWELTNHPPGGGTIIETDGKLYCVICVDSFINGKMKAHEMRQALTIAPHIQMFAIGQGQGAGVVSIPVCLLHRKEQLGIKSGLIIP